MGWRADLRSWGLLAVAVAIRRLRGSADRSLQPQQLLARRRTVGAHRRLLSMANPGRHPGAVDRAGSATVATCFARLPTAPSPRSLSGTGLSGTDPGRPPSHRSDPSVWSGRLDPGRVLAGCVRQPGAVSA